MALAAAPKRPRPVPGRLGAEGQISVAFERIETLEDALPAELGREDLPLGSGLPGRKVLHRLPPPRWDQTLGPARLYIGAHAAVTGRALLTRDTRRYRTLLPTLTLISPGASRTSGT